MDAVHREPADPLPGPLIRLSEVPPLPWLPRRGGKPPSLATIHRWASVGLHGRKLRTLRAGGALATTERWVLEFFECLSDETAVRPDRRTPTQRQRARARAAAELEAAGI
jgi:hypothetical protein